MNRVATRIEVEPLATAEPNLAEQVYVKVEAIRRIAYRMTRSHGAAQEITQDVLLRVCRRGGFDASRGTLDAWVQIVTQHTAIDWIRSEVAQQRRVAKVGAMHVATIPLVEDVVTDRSRATNLRAAVARLPDDERIVVSLAYFDELTYRQVAERLGLPEGTVKSRIRRALTRLAQTTAVVTPAATR